jgi:type VI secretion system protein VasG
MALLVEPKSIVRRLTPTCVKALDAAVGRAFNARCYEVTVEHMLLSLAESEDGDTARILHQYGQDRLRLVARAREDPLWLSYGQRGQALVFGQPLPVV